MNCTTLLGTLIDAHAHAALQHLVDPQQPVDPLTTATSGFTLATATGGSILATATSGSTLATATSGSTLAIATSDPH